MRQKLPADKKRNSPIGIKVKTITREQLDYIAEREGDTLSTHIDKVLRNHIDQYFTTNKINWDNIPPEERGGK